MRKTWIGTAKYTFSKRSGERRYKYTDQPGVHKTHTHYQVITVDGDIELTIELSALVELMGARALASKSGRSTMQGGIVKAKVLKRTETAGHLHEIPRGAHQIDVETPT